MINESTGKKKPVLFSCKKNQKIFQKRDKVACSIVFIDEGDDRGWNRLRYQAWFGSRDCANGYSSGLFVLGDDIYECIQTRENDYEDTKKEMDSVQNVLHKIPKPE